MARHAALALALLLALFAALSFASLRKKSATIDEYGYLPCAWNLVHSADMRYSEWHTPLVNTLLGLPLLGAQVAPPPEPPPGAPPRARYWFWNNGAAFLEANRASYQALLQRARLVSLFLTLALGLVVFAWARELCGGRAGLGAGLLAATLCLFYPDILAHSRFATLDMGLTFFFTLALYMLHRYLRRPTWRRALLLGLALGLAQAAKFTAITLVPIVALLFGWGLMASRARLPGSGMRTRSRRALLGHLVLILALALLTLQATYLFQEPLVAPSDLLAQSDKMSALQQWWPSWLKLPLPAQYLRAIDMQLLDQQGQYPCYLLGESTRGGRWDYFAVLLLTKTPLAGLALALLAMGAYLVRRAPHRLETFVLLGPVLLIVLLFSASAKQIGLRMVLQIIPLVAIWVAAVAAPLLRLGRRVLVPALALVLLYVASTLGVHPHYLSYFNLAAGGMEKGYKVALGSNYDWGQDLIALRAWMERRDLEQVELLYYGRVDPAVYGIGYHVPIPTPAKGARYLVVSASYYGMDYPVPDHGHSRKVSIPRQREKIFSLPLEERIAPTLFAFRLPVR